MASPITITLSNDLIYPGTTTQANVVIQVDKPTKVRNITARLHGYERAEAEYTDTDAEGDSVKKTETVIIDLLDEEFLLLGKPRKGFFGRLSDSASTLVGGGDHEVLQPGTYEYTVDLEIPDRAAPSLKGSLCKVEYSLQVNVDIPVKIDWSKTRRLKVRPAEVDFSQSNSAQATYPDEKGRSLWQKSFGKDVTLNLAIDRDCLEAGGEAMAILTVESPEPLKVKKIEVRLAGRESTNVRNNRDTSHHCIALGEVDAPNMIAGRSVHEFDIKVPNLTVPHSQSGSNFNIDWKFEAQIYIPWASDPIIRIPVTLHPSRPRSELA